MSADVLKFTGIHHHGSAGLGVFKLSKEQLGWACTEQGLSGQGRQAIFRGTDLEAARWQAACGKAKGLLKLALKGKDGVCRFGGFKLGDVGALKAHLKDHFDIELAEDATSTSGWSWGNWSLDNGKDFQVLVDGGVAFELPLSGISQVSAAKSELHVEMHEDPSMQPAEESLHDIRFFVPDGNPLEGSLSTEELKAELQRLAGTSAGGGEAIARVDDITVVAPRGKHNLEFFPQFIKILGKTQTYTVYFRHITRLFLLNMPNETQVALIIGLEKPIRQGQQLHSFLTLLMDKQKEIEAKLPPAQLKELNLVEGQATPVYGIVAQLFKVLSGGKSVVSESSQVRTPGHCVKCLHKTSQGFLFPLKKSMIFITKPIIHIKYDDVVDVTFGMNVMRRNSFDLLAKLKNGNVIEFSSLERTLFDEVARFLKEVGVTLANLSEVQGQLNTASSRASRGAPATRTAALLSKQTSQGEAESSEDPDDSDFDAEGKSDKSDSEMGSDESDDDDAGDDDDEPVKKKPKRK